MAGNRGETHTDRGRKQTMKKLILLAAAITTLSGSMLMAADDRKVGTVQITVLDENGALVQDAPVYIYGTQKTRFVGGQEVPGSTTMSMPAGTYKISSAIVKRSGDYVDRFASHEANITVEEGDNASVILTLRPINDPTSSVVYAELRKIGVAPVLVQNNTQPNNF